MCLYNFVQAAGVSHQCVQLQHNHGATLPPSAQTRTCMTQSQQLSLLHLPLRSHLPSPFGQVRISNTLYIMFTPNQLSKGAENGS